MTLEDTDLSVESFEYSFDTFKPIFLSLSFGDNEEGQEFVKNLGDGIDRL